jgi:hypothetical protein
MDMDKNPEENKYETEVDTIVSVSNNKSIQIKCK